MSPLTITIPHQLGKEEARKRMEEGFARLGAQLAAGPGFSLGSMQHAWEADRLNFSANAAGQCVSGRLDVSEREIRIEVDLPQWLTRFADVIAGRLKREGRLLLEKK